VRNYLFILDAYSNQDQFGTICTDENLLVYVTLNSKGAYELNVYDSKDG
jgi:hypothetical protein